MKSQNKQLLAAFKAGQVIDSDYAKAKFGIARLAARVYDLKQQGYPIHRLMQTMYNRYGEKVRYAVYWLPKEFKEVK